MDLLFPTEWTEGEDQGQNYAIITEKRKLNRILQTSTFHETPAKWGHVYIVLVPPEQK